MRLGSFWPGNHPLKPKTGLERATSPAPFPNRERVGHPALQSRRHAQSLTPMIAPLKPKPGLSGPPACFPFSQGKQFQNCQLCSQLTCIALGLVTSCVKGGVKAQCAAE